MENMRSVMDDFIKNRSLYYTGFNTILPGVYLISCVENVVSQDFLIQIAMQMAELEHNISFCLYNMNKFELVSKVLSIYNSKVDNSNLNPLSYYKKNNILTPNKFSTLLDNFNIWQESWEASPVVNMSNKVIFIDSLMNLTTDLSYIIKNVKNNLVFIVNDNGTFNPNCFNLELEVYGDFCSLKLKNNKYNLMYNSTINLDLKYNKTTGSFTIVD